MLFLSRLTFNGKADILNERGCPGKKPEGDPVDVGAVTGSGVAVVRQLITNGCI
jgi:hypothetical protein